MAARQKSMQPASVQIGNSWMALAEADIALNAPAAATTEAQKADDTFRAALGPSSVFLARSRTVMAEVAAAKGDWEQSRTLSRQALELSKANLAADNPVVARAESDLGWALWKLGNADQAAPLLEGAHKIDREKFHEGSSTRASARVAAQWEEFSAARRVSVGLLDRAERGEAAILVQDVDGAEARASNRPPPPR